MVILASKIILSNCQCRKMESWAKKGPQNPFCDLFKKKTKKKSKKKLKNKFFSSKIQKFSLVQVVFGFSSVRFFNVTVES